MGTIRSYFSDPYPVENEQMGIITGTFLLSRLPDVPGKLFGLKALSTNGSSVFIGNTRSTGGYPTTPTLPWEIEPGETIGWISSDNLNRYYMAGCSGSLYLSYWVQG